jgi:hypothetical protein
MWLILDKNIGYFTRVPELSFIVAGDKKRYKVTAESDMWCNNAEEKHCDFSVIDSNTYISAILQ